MSDMNDRFEALAEQFRKETDVWPPGKSMPQGMCPDEYAIRHKFFNFWMSHRWIPVSERLPEDDDIVDVIAEIKKRTETKKTIRRICDIRWSTIETYPGSYTFTHWRPITLPKGE